MKSQTLKTTVVLVATHERTQVFRSVESVPVTVRNRMLATASRGNSATILIADRRGRQELARAAQGMPSPVKLRRTRAVRSGLLSLVRRNADWVDVALLGLAGTLVWIAAVVH
jgi:hypothetical protein